MSTLRTGFFSFVFLFRSLGYGARQARIQHKTFCRDPHRGFDSFYLKHAALIDCRVAELVARYAVATWEQVREEFPELPLRRFLLKVVDDEHDHRPGYKIRGTSIVVINLAHHSLDQEQELRDTLSEELHHLAWYWVFGEKEKDLKFDPEEGHEGVVHYYAFNRHELAALRFSVRTVGARAELLREVEEFLGTAFESRGLPSIGNKSARRNPGT